MNTFFYVVHMYVTRILLVTVLAYAFLTHGSPTCPGRLEKNSPTFFSDEYEKSLHTSKSTTINKEIDNQELNIETQEEDHA